MRRPILVTGSHRSGSTWVGQMVALSPQVVYFHEPFNSDYYRPGICGARFSYRFTYVTTENEADYYPHFSKMARFSYNWWEALKQVTHWRDLPQLHREAQVFEQHGQRGQRALFKDPLALLSAEWLATRLQMDMVVLIRHPAAFVSSIKRFNWRSPIAELLAQPLLMRDYLYPYREEMLTCISRASSIVVQAALFWKLLYYVVTCYQRRQPSWHFVRHEDLSREPMTAFAALFDHVGLSFTEAIAATIAAYTSPDNPAEAPQYHSSTKLNSRANIWNWKQRLTSEEIAQVRAITEEVAAVFYGEDAW